MAKLHLVEGPVGAGKSTFARALVAQTAGVHIALDEWFARLFSADRPAGDWVPWYVARKERLLELIWIHAIDLLRSGSHVALELRVCVLDAPQALRRERVRRRNVERGTTFSMVVPDHVFELASDLWEAPDAHECSEVGITFIPPASGPR